MRDVLIALLVIGIAMNVAVLLVAIMARPRPAASDDAESSAAILAPPPATRRAPAVRADEPGAAVAHAGSGVRASPASRGRATTTTYLSTRPDLTRRSDPVVPPGAAFHATTVPPTSTSVLSPVPAAAELTVDLPAPAAADNGVPPPVDPVALASPISSRAEPGDGTGRRRRFVLPRLDEDRARSDRAIAAVLGEIDTSGVTRPAVRRQRSRRVTGEPVPHTEVLLADMTRYAADFMYALARAMEQCTRDTDRVQVLPDGSVRLVLEADDVGAGAFVQRARELLGPWLQFAGASVEFRVRPLAPVGSALGIGEPSARDR